jgi:hypothetical protein
MKSIWADMIECMERSASLLYSGKSQTIASWHMECVVVIAIGVCS